LEVTVMRKVITFIQQRWPEAYFRIMERVGRRTMRRVTFPGDFVEEFGWEFRGQFYPKHFREEPIAKEKRRQEPWRSVGAWPVGNDQGCRRCQRVAGKAQLQQLVPTRAVKVLKD
jgi:hypothetical protein